jgi:murein L,D-transpeptidase YcbB/YkuD
MAFQKALGLTADGIVGRFTLAALEKNGGRLRLWWSTLVP